VRKPRRAARCPGQPTSWTSPRSTSRSACERGNATSRSGCRGKRADGTTDTQYSDDSNGRLSTVTDRLLSQVVDPQGHTVTLTYDQSFRLVALTDALGQVTTLDYLDAADPLRLTKVTDPFGRAATFTYDPFGRLATLTDVAGLTASVRYGAGDFITALTTPYGTTTFRQEGGDPGTPDPEFRRIEATDPLGATERVEFHRTTTLLAAQAPSNEVPAGFEVANDYLHWNNTFYWDKLAMAGAPGDVEAAVITNWLQGSTLAYGFAQSRNVPHSVKRPLESRVWYRYPDQPATHHGVGSGTSPSLTGRVLEGGVSQVTAATYNAQGQVTSKTDALGRQTTYTYATNGLDLLEVRQVRTGGGTDLVQSYGDYDHHQPGTVTDAAGQTTTLTYNARGQVLTTTNARDETTTNTYDSETGVLLTTTGPVSGATTTFGYDGYGRLESVTDADGYGDDGL
jgi:YD repeat-containing protein